ncbi:MAG: hypothetical protein JWO11_3564 [Nocardioides sp.]|nr:hypothetical protein [Nocardioides sp.]
MTTKRYYAKRGAATVGATVIGLICAVLWVAGAILIGSRLGELWAGDRRAAA